MCFPVPGISLDTKWGMNISWTNKGKKESCYFPTCASLKKTKWTVSFSGLSSLMNFPSYQRLDLCQMSSSRKHISLAEVQLSLSCSKGWVSGETPAIHPQPTPNLMQFLLAFSWPAKPVLSLHKNSTLWHLINKRTPWPGYTFVRKGTQKTSSHPCIHISWWDATPVPSGSQPWVICSPGKSWQWEGAR